MSERDKALVRMEYRGKTYEFNLLKTSTEELREIKRKTGMTVNQFITGTAEADVDALLCLKWVMLRSDGQHDTLVLNPNDPFPDYWEIAEAWNKATEVAAEKLAETPPDPTPASLQVTSTLEWSESSMPTSTISATSTPSPSPITAESANGRSDGSPSEASSDTSSASTSC